MEQLNSIEKSLLKIIQAVLFCDNVEYEKQDFADMDLKLLYKEANMQAVFPLIHSALMNLGMSDV